MRHLLMTRYHYNLPGVLLERLQALSDKKGRPINALITQALIDTYPELRSLPSHTLASLLGTSSPKPST